MYSFFLAQIILEGRGIWYRSFTRIPNVIRKKRVWLSFVDTEILQFMKYWSYSSLYEVVIALPHPPKTCAKNSPQFVHLWPHHYSRWTVSFSSNIGKIIILIKNKIERVLVKVKEKDTRVAPRNIPQLQNHLVVPSSTWFQRTTCALYPWTSMIELTRKYRFLGFISAYWWQDTHGAAIHFIWHSELTKCH